MVGQSAWLLLYGCHAGDERPTWDVELASSMSGSGHFTSCCRCVFWKVEAGLYPGHERTASPIALPRGIHVCMQAPVCEHLQRYRGNWGLRFLTWITEIKSTGFPFIAKLLFGGYLFGVGFYGHQEVNLGGCFFSETLEFDSANWGRCVFYNNRVFFSCLTSRSAFSSM